MTAPFVAGYTEGADTVAFAPPRTVRLEPGGCTTDLDDDGNMWTGHDVESALADPAVQKALTDRETYKSAYGPAHLTTASGSITWVIAWKELPPPEPASVHHLQEVLHVVLTNRRSLCRK
jgi:hypothetical protein